MRLVFAARGKAPDKTRSGILRDAFKQWHIERGYRDRYSGSWSKAFKRLSMSEKSSFSAFSSF
jgi:hypothetical protein